MYQVCIKYVSSMYQVCIKYVSSMYQVCIKYVSSMYQVCIKYVSSMYQVCIKYVSSMYQVCINNYYSFCYNGEWMLGLNDDDDCRTESLPEILQYRVYPVSRTEFQNVIQTQKCVPCREYAKPNRCVLSALQKYLNQKGKTLNQPAKHFNCWGQPPQKLSSPSQSDD